MTLEWLLVCGTRDDECLFCLALFNVEHLFSKTSKSLFLHVHNTFAFFELNQKV